jgi:hypothetical protein
MGAVANGEVIGTFYRAEEGAEVVAGGWLVVSGEWSLMVPVTWWNDEMAPFREGEEDNVDSASFLHGAWGRTEAQRGGGAA